MKVKVLLFLSGLFFMACQENEPAADHASALPHTSALPTSNLSATDKAKMAAAKGKKVTDVDVYDVEQMFDAAENRLHIFCFWQLDCESCKHSIEHINQALEGIDSEKYRLVLINLDEKSQLAAVNTYIRTQNLFAETYRLDGNQKNWADGVHENWNGKLPATFFVKSAEEINVKIQREIEKNELAALLNSLVL